MAMAKESGKISVNRLKPAELIMRAIYEKEKNDEPILWYRMFGTAC
jgi:hypothetical protein